MGGRHSLPEFETANEKTFLVTGANTGIGYEVAKYLATLGARVVIGCRSEERALQAIQRMTEEIKAEGKKNEAKKDEGKKDEAKIEEGKTDETKPHEEKKDEAKPDETKKDEEKGEGSEDDVKSLNIQYMHLDLSSFKSTLEFVENYKASGLPLHVLICNAGMVARQKVVSDDGFEKMFQVNYLSHFLLTLHLIPLLKKTAFNTRVINVTSQSKLQPLLKKINFDDIQGQPYSATSAITNSKSYQIMNMYAFCKRLKADDDRKVSIFSVHPGYVNTFIGKDATGGFKKAMATAVNNSGLFVSGRIGSLGVLNAALNTELDDKTGIYFLEQKQGQHASFISDIENQDKLWDYSLSCLKEHLTDEVLQEVGETLENIKPIKNEDGETGSKVKGEDEGAAGGEITKEETEKPEKEEEAKKEIDEVKDGGEDKETKET